MSNAPHDPAGESIDQSQREADSYGGQTGHETYDDQQFSTDVTEDAAVTGRSGSYETNNQGGYGTGQPDAEGQVHSEDNDATTSQ